MAQFVPFVRLFRASRQTVARGYGKLTVEFGRGFSQQNLFRMVELVQVFPDQQIVATLSGQLGWSHFVELVSDTELPPKRILQQKLHKAALLAQDRLAAKDKQARGGI